MSASIFYLSFKLFDMKNYIFSFFLLITVAASAQIKSVSLQASGLTCSMCSKAIYKSLSAISFVQSVDSDIKNSITYQRYNLYDECWNIPQMTNTNHYYLKTLLRCNTIEVPFIWSPEFIDNEYQYKKRSECSKKIAIFEPNLSIMKWAFPAVLICENAYRDPEFNDKIKHIYITNTDTEKFESFNKTHFNIWEEIIIIKFSLI